MKLCLMFLILIFSVPVFGARLQLPRGGSVSVDERIWDVQPIEMGGEKLMTLFHRQHKDLQGFILGGQIREVGACVPKLKDKKWVFCRKTFQEKGITNEQVHAQKKVSKSSFQNYVFTFNLPKGKEKEYRVQVESLLKTLEASP